MTRKYFPDKYEEAKKKLTEELQLVDNVSLTTDLWSSRNNMSFMTVTIHYITNKMKMITRVLCNVCVNENYNAKNLKNRLKSTAEEWNITEKISAITTDNAGNIVAAVRELG